MQLTHIAQRVFGVPLMIHPPKLEIILKAIGPRLVSDPDLWSMDVINELRGLGTLSNAQVQPLSPRSPLSPIQSQARAAAESRTPNSYYITESGVAIVPIHGTLMKRASGIMALSGCSTYENIGASIECAATNPEVRAILLDIDSPGGETHGCFELTDLIYSLRSQKPIWSSANDMAASAAYALASATSRVYVTRTGAIGSIGIVSCHMDQSGADEKAGLKFTYIHAGARKIDGVEHVPLSGKAQAIWKAEIDRQYAIFTEAVGRNRKMSAKDVADTEAGVFYAENGVEAGLADKVGTFEEALADLKAKVSPPNSSLDRVGSRRRVAQTVPMRTAAISSIPAPASGLRVAAGAAHISGLKGLSRLSLPSVHESVNQGETMAKKSKQALAAEQKAAADRKARQVKAQAAARVKAKQLAAARALVAEADAAEAANAEAVELDDVDDLETGVETSAESDDLDIGAELDAEAEYMEDAETDASAATDECDAEDATEAAAAALPDDDEDDVPAPKGKKAKAAKVAAPAPVAGLAAMRPGRSPHSEIAEACELAGKPALATRFIRKFDAGGITVKGVRNFLLDQRAAASRSTTVSGAVAPAGATKLDALEQAASTLASASAGKLTRAGAYTQLLMKNPGAYAAYVKERNYGVRNEMAAEKYLQMLGQRFPTGVMS